MCVVIWNLQVPCFTALCCFGNVSECDSELCVLGLTLSLDKHYLFRGPIRIVLCGAASPSS